tara:strand:+ start:202 stop:1005 length:804 start_codon:yes stop_codon:yes gene_type:complete
MKIFINGCSHTAISYSCWYNSKKQTIHQPRNRKSWITFLEDKLNISHLASIYTNPAGIPKQNYDEGFALGELGGSLRWMEGLSLYRNKPHIISLATDGKGNDSILFDSLNYLRYCKRENIKLDYVCIQWSGPGRRLVTSDIEDLVFANPHENYQFGTNLEPGGSFHTLNYMVILQNYLKENNINYNFISYFPLDKRVIDIDKKLYRELDKTKFLSYKKYHPIVEGWLPNILKDGLAIDSDGHPNEDLMEIISDKVFKNILKYNKKIQ